MSKSELSDEEVWLRAYCSTIHGFLSGKHAHNCSTDEEFYSAVSDNALTEFRKRFQRKIEAKNAESV